MTKLPELITKFILLLIITAVFHPGIGFSQEMLSLEDAIKTGLENNYSIRFARNDAEIARNNNSIGSAGFLPQVSGNAGQSGSVTSSRQEFLTGQTNDRKNASSQNTNARALLNWTIFDGFQMFSTKQKLAELESQGEANVRLIVETAVADIVQGYYNIVRQQMQLQVLQDALDISSDRIEIARTKLDLGSGSGLELLQARADYNADKSAYLRQEVTVQNSKTRMNEILARDLNTQFSIPDTTIQIGADLVLDTLLEKTQAENSRLQRARINRDIASLNLREIQSERFPEIGVNVGYNYQRSESEAGFLKTNRSTGYDFGISTSISLFNGFNVNRRVQNAKIQVKTSQFEYMDIENQVKSGLQQAFENYRINLELVELEQENIEVARQTLEVARERYRLGTLTAVELKEAQRTYIAAESRLVDTQYQAKIYETELLRLSNQLGENIR